MQVAAGAIVIIAVAISTLPVTVEAQSEETVLESSLTPECFHLLYTHQCKSTNYARRAADVSLSCGENYVTVAENYAAVCTQNDAGEYCLNVPEFQFGTGESGIIIEQIVASCPSIVTMNSSCNSDCRNALRDLVQPHGCCFKTVFNERLSQLIIGYNMDIFTNACNITAQSPCDASDFGDLEIPNNADSCTPNEFWSRIANFTCNSSNAQPEINALTKDPTCIPLARHTVNVCSRGPKNRYCLDIFGTSFNPFFPERTLRLNPVLNNVTIFCANYSSFQSEGCPSACESALQAAIAEIGCCVNLFNDNVNEIMLPYFSDDVMKECDVVFPPKCKSDLKIMGDDPTPSGSAHVMASHVISWASIILYLYF